MAQALPGPKIVLGKYAQDVYTLFFPNFYLYVLSLLLYCFVVKNLELLGKKMYNNFIILALYPIMEDFYD